MCCVPWINLHLLDAVCICVGGRFDSDYHPSPFITHPALNNRATETDVHPCLHLSIRAATKCAHTSARANSSRCPYWLGLCLDSLILQMHTPMVSWRALPLSYVQLKAQALVVWGVNLFGERRAWLTGRASRVFNAVSAGINHSVQLGQFPLNFLFVRSTTMLTAHTAVPRKHAISRTHTYMKQAAQVSNREKAL